MALRPSILGSGWRLVETLSRRREGRADRRTREDREWIQSERQLPLGKDKGQDPTDPSASRQSIAPTRERTTDARRSSRTRRTCAGLKRHRLLVRAGRRCWLAGQGDIVDARVRRQDDLEG